MVRNLLVLVAIKEALESPMELLLDNNPKKAFEL
jgi:2-oxoglutarate dehydrogenase E2 component (dihydrolipoamide succinyltransferase)